MAHINQMRFCESVKELYPKHFQNKKVLDIGSLDLNGNNKYLFNDSFYLGVDIAKGPNVDLISLAHNLTFRDEFFDTIISTEALEHDVFYYLTLNNMVRMLKSKGLMIFTCATTGRPEHGTLKNDYYTSPLTVLIEGWGNYYKNLIENDIRFCLDVDKIFKDYKFSINEETCDLYFYGIKK